MIHIFFDGHDELYHRAKFGKITQCRCENVVFVVFFVTLRVRSTVRSRVHSSNKSCVAVYCPISTRFSPFFRMDYSFRCTT